MSGRNVNLTGHLSTFVDDQVRNGRHHNASEVVREALRRHEDAIQAERERVEAIRDVIREGRSAVARGDFTTISGPEDKEALFARLTRRAPEPRTGGTV